MEMYRAGTKGHKQKEEVFLFYGAGILNYFELQRQLMKMFCVLSLLAIPQMILFYSFGGLRNVGDVGLYVETSMGNIGFSTSDCSKAPIYFMEESTPLHFTC